MPVPSPRPPEASRPHDVRRLRDLLRAALAGRRFPDMRLPGEGELMVGFGVSRSTVRDALALLRDEGLIDPPGGGDTRGVAPLRHIRPAPEPAPAGRTVAETAHRETDECDVRAHDADECGVRAQAGPSAGSGHDGPHSRLLDRVGVPAPAPLAAWLGVRPGAPCLRIEFVTVEHGAPSAVATHYVLQPEAAELLAFPMRADWSTLLDDAGLGRRTTEVELGHVPADPAVAELLAVPAGTVLLAAEETTSDAYGRVFDAGVLRMVERPGDRAVATEDGATPGHRAAG